MKSRLFLDSNILIGGITGAWDISRAVLMLCGRGIHQAVIAQAVVEEVERGLLKKTYEHESSQRRYKKDAARLIDDYGALMKFMKPQIVPHAPIEIVKIAAGIIHHLNDAPVLAAALTTKPDWILSNNSDHFSPAVSRKIAIRIATPLQFFTEIHRS